MNHEKKRILLHAPGVHTGGGLVLLKAILNLPDLPPMVANLDSRVIGKLHVPPSVELNIIEPTGMSRFIAEFRLKTISRIDDLLFCFHGLPPLFRCSAHVSVFVQNRLNLREDTNLKLFKKSCLKTFLKQYAFHSMRNNVDEYVVQTPSMRNLLTARFRNDMVPIRMLPFLDEFNIDANEILNKYKEYDFIYVADGVAHKNHYNLIKAWILLANEGLRPSLLLTLSKRDQLLLDSINKAKLMYDLHISNEGDVDRARVLEFYQRSRALVFPSLCESFGIPLIEATKLRLPIVASEMDYVRDVCAPCETFDPSSPISIARAIKRFLGCSEAPLVPSSAQEFIKKLIL